MRGIFVLLIGIVVSTAPVFAAIHSLGPPVSAGHDGCGEKNGHDGDQDKDHEGCGDDDDDDGCGETGDHDGDHEHDDDDCDDNGGAAGTGRLISESAILNGLEAGALFPFIDTTPNNITRAHIAITDVTETCTAGASAPQNIQVLVGVAGGSLVNVMTDATNTGIGSSQQCVFHVTIVPGQAGVPSQVTDIVIVNAGEGPLTGLNTVTATAEVA